MIAAFLGDSYNVKQDGNNLFIESKGSLYRFDLQTGRFLSKIGCKGEGPEEYVSLGCYYVDRQRKQLGVIDRYRSKLLRYEYNGHFIEAFSIPESLSDINFMEMNNDGMLLLNHHLLDNYSSPEYEYSLVSLEEKELKLKKEFIFNKYNSGNVSGRSSFHPIGYDGSSAYFLFSAALSDILYEYINGKLIEKYKVMVPTPFPDSTFLAKNKKIEWHKLVELVGRKGFCSGISHVSDIPQYTILDVGRYHLIWDKKRNEGIVFPYFIEERDKLVSSILSTDGTVVVYSASNFIGGSNNEYLETGANESLKQLIRTINEESNPVVRILYYKDDLGFLKKKHGVE